MTAKEYVLQKYPDARSERHLSGRIKGMQKPYWLIRRKGIAMYMAEGKTESNAWVNAKKLIEEQQNKNV